MLTSQGGGKAPQDEPCERQHDLHGKLLEEFNVLAALQEESWEVLQRVGEKQRLFVEAARVIVEARAGTAERAPAAAGATAGADAGADIFDSGGNGDGSGAPGHAAVHASDTGLALAAAGGCSRAVLSTVAWLDDCASQPAQRTGVAAAPPGSVAVAPAGWKEEEESSSGLGSPNGVPHLTGTPSGLGSATMLVRNDSLDLDDIMGKETSFPEFGQVPLLQWARMAAHRLLAKPAFHYVVGSVIIANAICIGVEIDMELRHESPSAVITLEYFFLGFYILELSLHFLADGWRCLQNGWVLFDFVLVMVGWVSMCIVGPLGRSLEGQGSGVNEVLRRFKQILILRLARFFILARTLRLVHCFASLWKLVMGFVQSIYTMLSTVVLITITIYVFACLGAEIITKDETLREVAEVELIVDYYFSSVPTIMLTLLQFSTQDSISAIYFPLIVSRPSLLVYFAPIILILSVAIMNLVTAVIVEDALSTAATDRETRCLDNRRQLRRLMPILQGFFVEIDSSGDGQVQIDEILANLPKIKNSVPHELRHIMNRDKLVDLFSYLDSDGSNTLSQGEFVDGLCHLVLGSVPVETMQTLQLLRSQSVQMSRLHQDLAHLLQTQRGRPYFTAERSRTQMTVTAEPSRQDML